MVTIASVSKFPVQPEAFYLRDLLQRLLETTESFYETAGVPLPSRRYWCLGEAAEDCAQLTVVFQNMNLGTPGEQQNEPMPCNGPRFATVQINVTRDIVNSENTTPPGADRIQASSEWMALDAWLLMDNLSAYDVGPYGTRGSGVLATVSTPKPSGNVQTTTLTLTIGLL